MDDLRHHMLRCRICWLLSVVGGFLVFLMVLLAVRMVLG